ncbi:MAG: hypothetical protein GEU93_12900 [Propionibacteriales bacterium]|nr:hypothetical protein [Propionibacteriales bacterium]
MTATPTKTPDKVAATAESEGSTGLPRLTRLAAEIVAPTTLLTALLFYFGWSHAYWFFDYFGVSSTVLGLTTQDYLMRAVDGLFVPLIVLAVGALLVIWTAAVLPAHVDLGLRARFGRVAVRAFATAGLVLVTNGLSRILWSTPFNQGLAVAPLCLGFGVVFLMYAVRLWRRTHAITSSARKPDRLPFTEWAAAFVLVALSLFWAANDYSAAVGTSRAKEFVRGLPDYPRAIVFSEQSLNMDAPGVREVRCQGAESGYAFRYDGLVLMLHADDQYVLLPEQWTPASGSAIILPRNDSLRLEFLPSASRGLRPTC